MEKSGRLLSKAAKAVGYLPRFLLAVDLKRLYSFSKLQL